MTKTGLHALLCTLLVMLCALPAMTETALFPGKIEFRGVINVSGRDIVRRAGISRSGKEFSVDMERLNRVLGSDVMIDSYEIVAGNGKGSG